MNELHQIDSPTVRLQADTRIRMQDRTVPNNNIFNHILYLQTCCSDHYSRVLFLNCSKKYNKDQADHGTANHTSCVGMRYLVGMMLLVRTAEMAGEKGGA